VIKVNIKRKIKGAAVLVNNTDGDVLLLKRSPESRFAPDKWGYPGGKIEKGETPEEAAIRETQEETQLQLQSITPLGVVNGVVEAFYSNDFAGNVEIDFEHTDWKWVPPSELGTYDLAPSALDIYEEARKLHE
jgi:8-oxo-dGTP diphosphatase